jgi:NADH:ubiquinone oxidoreductase subunit 5 (subunit L)/multisubunit Na+/H+ antiporter MnhA subunit
VLELFLVLSYAFMLLLIVVYISKSAMLPFSSWLISAMAAATPVSALLHSSTMVIAGTLVGCVSYGPALVYVMLNSYYSFLLYSLALYLITLTLIYSCFYLLYVSDIKSLIAYSTINQLAYIFLALFSFNSAYLIYHICTHAFFKSMLFLLAGSLIHVCSSAQSLYRLKSSCSLLKSLFAISLLLSLLNFSKELILHYAHLSLCLASHFYVFSFSIIVTVAYSLKLFYAIFSHTSTPASFLGSHNDRKLFSSHTPHHSIRHNSISPPASISPNPMLSVPMQLFYAIFSHSASISSRPYFPIPSNHISNSNPTRYASTSTAAISTPYNPAAILFPPASTLRTILASMFLSLARFLSLFLSYTLIFPLAHIFSLIRSYLPTILYYLPFLYPAHMLLLSLFSLIPARVSFLSSSLLSSFSLLILFLSSYRLFAIFYAPLFAIFSLFSSLANTIIESLFAIFNQLSFLQHPNRVSFLQPHHNIYYSFRLISAKLYTMLLRFFSPFTNNIYYSWLSRIYSLSFPSAHTSPRFNSLFSLFLQPFSIFPASNNIYYSFSSFVLISYALTVLVVDSLFAAVFSSVSLSYNSFSLASTLAVSLVPVPLNLYMLVFAFSVSFAFYAVLPLTLLPFSILCRHAERAFYAISLLSFSSLNSMRRTTILPIFAVALFLLPCLYFPNLLSE